MEFIEAHQRARGQYMIFANMRGTSTEDVRGRVFAQPDLGGLQGPTISPMITREENGYWWAINIVTNARKLYDVIRQIRAIGGSGVVVTPVTYIFEEAPERYQRLVSALDHKESCLMSLPVYDDLSQARATILKRASLRDVTLPDWLSASLEKLFGEPVSADEAVRRIIRSVREQGDAALFDWNRRIDRADLDQLAVPEDEITAALDQIPADVADALKLAADRIRAFHDKQPVTGWIDAGQQGSLGPVDPPGGFGGRVRGRWDGSAAVVAADERRSRRRWPACRRSSS